MLSMLLTVALAGDGAPLNGLALADVARNLPECQTSPTTAALDLDAGCVNEACAGMTREALDAASGEPAECHESSHTTGLTHCSWLGGAIEAQFHDTKGPGATSLFVTAPDWRTADGLGVGSALSCFLDRFGHEASGVRVDVEDGWLIWHSVQFGEPRVIATVSQDGTVEKLQLSGPSRGRRQPLGSRPSVALPKAPITPIPIRVMLPLYVPFDDG